MRRALLFILPAAIALGSPPLAAGQREALAPPGNSAIDQYQESIPVVSGAKPTRSVPQVPRRVLSSDVRRTLESMGGAGSALSTFVESTGVPGASTRTPEGKPGRAFGSGVRTATKGSVPIANILGRSLVGSPGGAGGMGWVLPVLLGAIALSGIAVSLRRVDPT